MDQRQKADLLRGLHQKGSPVILYNIWDAGSAKAVAEAGAQAIATGSAPVAMAQGYNDGENIPLDLALDNVRRIAAATPLPVSLDFEGAYGNDPEVVAENFANALQTGVVGFNFEDQIVGEDGLYGIEAQSKRLKAAQQACSDLDVNAFINARTDLFLKAKMSGESHSQSMLDEAVERADAFREAGASGFFAPGLSDLDMIAELCDRVPLPVNIIALPGAPENHQLAEAGVARISYGPVPYRKMTKWLVEQAKTVFSGLDR